jgi:hypothetical protein
MADETWLEAMASFADAHERTPGARRPGIEILAMLLFHECK